MPPSKQTEKLLEAMATEEALVNQDLSKVLAKNKPAFQIAINEAKEKYGKLFGEYKKYITDNAFLIVTTGPEKAQKEFSESLTKLAGAVAIDGASLYKRFAEVIDPSMHPTARLFSTTQQSLLMAEMNAVMSDLNIRSLPMPKFKEVKICKTFDAVVDASREMVRGSNADELNKLYIEAAICKSARAAEYSQKTVPVILTSLTPDEIEKLPQTVLSGNHMTLDIPQTVTEEFLAESAKKIRDTIATKKRK